MRGGRKFAQFGMTREEKRMLALIAFLLLVGLAGRYWHLRSRQPEPYAPPEPPGAAPAARSAVEE